MSEATLEEAYEADILRSMTALSESWDKLSVLCPEEMNKQLDALIRVVEGRADYNEFMNEINTGTIPSQSRLN